MQDSSAPKKETKGTSLYQVLRDEAYARGAHGRLPTVRELCERFATTRTTLMQVLSELEAHDIIYRKQGSGLYASPKLFRKTIGIVMNANWLSNSARLSPVWGLLWGLLAQEAEQRSQSKNEYYCLHTLLPSSALPVSEEMMHLVATGRLQGVLNIGMPYETVAWLTAQGVPCISLYIHGPWTIELDVAEMIRQAVAHLVQKGCQKIGLWAIDPTHRSSTGTFAPEADAFRYFLADHGVPYYPELVRPVLPPIEEDGTPRVLTNQQQGYHIALDVFAHSDGIKPDGLVLMDDMLTDGALVALLEQGIHLGEQLHMVTHANAGTMSFLEYVHGMSVIEFDPRHIIEQMFAILDPLLRGEQVPPRRVAIPPRWRRSTDLSFRKDTARSFSFIAQNT